MIKTTFACSMMAFLTCLMLACNSKIENESQTKLLQKVDSLITENNKLNQRLKDASLQTKSNSVNQTENNTIQTSNKKYAFVVLTSNVTEPYFDKVIERMITKTEKYSVCSKVKFFDDFNDDIKYQFMDEFQTTYMAGKIQGGSYSTRISERECFAFNTYEEASKKRETYLVNKE